MNSNENVNNPHRLEELGGSDYKVAEGEENIKGWKVEDANGNKLGKVDELIFDNQSLKVRYLVLNTAGNDLDLDKRKVLIPIGMSEIDSDDDDVILPNISADQIRSMPEYDEDNLNDEYEGRNYGALTGVADTTGTVGVANDFYENEYFNDENLFRRRRNASTADMTDQTSENSGNAGETTIPVIEEQLNVGKREVQRGGIRITSQVIETPVEETINLREEHVTVQRHSVDRAATDADFDRALDRNIEVTEHAEVPVVSKDSRVVEEITVNKDVTNRDETISDTVRRTEVDVDDLDENISKTNKNQP